MVFFSLRLAIITSHFKNVTKFHSFLSLAIASCHLSYLALPHIFLLCSQIPIVLRQYFETHITRAYSHIFLSFPKFLKKVNIFLPLAILNFHFKNLAQFHSFLSLAITSCHLPYLAQPPIFPLYFQIPPVIWQYLTSCLPSRFP